MHRIAVLLALACAALPAFGTGGGHGHSAAPSLPSLAAHAPGSTHSSSASRSRAQPGVRRDSHGRIARDPRAINAFKRQFPCPSTGRRKGACPGYVIVHVKPLKRGGDDAPSNMQWQSREAAKAKDKWE